MSASHVTADRDRRTRYIVLLFYTLLSMAPTLAAEASCAIGDLQSCSSCPQLGKVIDLARPDSGEYYRGAYWNGLFAAYRLNCLDIGKRLLERKANPNLGGASGSFLATLVQPWPHNKESINREWVNLTKNYSVDPNWKNPWTGESAIEIIAKGEVAVSYPDLWSELTRRKEGPP